MLLLEGLCAIFQVWDSFFDILKNMDDELKKKYSEKLQNEFLAAKRKKNDFEEKLLFDIKNFLSSYKELRIVQNINLLFELQAKYVTFQL